MNLYMKSLYDNTLLIILVDGNSKAFPDFSIDYPLDNSYST